MSNKSTIIFFKFPTRNLVVAFTGVTNTNALTANSSQVSNMESFALIFIQNFSIHLFSPMKVCVDHSQRNVLVTSINLI